MKNLLEDLFLHDYEVTFKKGGVYACFAIVVSFEGPDRKTYSKTQYCRWDHYNSSYVEDVIKFLMESLTEELQKKGFKK